MNTKGLVTSDKYKEGVRRRWENAEGTELFRGHYVRAKILELLGHLERRDRTVVALSEALLPFARAGFRQTNRFAAYHGACFTPWSSEDMVTLEVRDEVIDRALYALGVYQEDAEGVTIDAEILEGGG